MCTGASQRWLCSASGRCSVRDKIPSKIYWGRCEARFVDGILWPIIWPDDGPLCAGQIRAFYSYIGGGLESRREVVTPITWQRPQSQSLPDTFLTFMLSLPQRKFSDRIIFDYQRIGATKWWLASIGHLSLHFTKTTRSLPPQRMMIDDIHLERVKFLTLNGIKGSCGPDAAGQ